MSTPTFPSRDDGGTTRPARGCLGCGAAFVPTGRALHCSNACRKRAFRARHATAAVVAPAAAGRRQHTVYECPECGTRQLGVQRCQDCAIFGRAAGVGGECPHCGEPVTAADLGLSSGAGR